MHIDEITPGSLPDAALRDAAERLQKERRRAEEWRSIAAILMAFLAATLAAFWIK